MSFLESKQQNINIEKYNLKMRGKKTRDFACLTRALLPRSRSTRNFARISSSLLPRSRSTRNFARISSSLLPRSRSGSHVGMILSFVIFITFIVFLYVVVQPAVKTGENKKTTLDYIESKIVENVSANFTSISIKIANKQSLKNQNCIKLQQFFVYSGISAYIVVKNETENVQNAYYDPATDFDDVRINRNNEDNLFFKIYYSLEFDKVPTTAINPCTLVYYNKEYNISSMTTGKYVFNTSMSELINYYKMNYEDLKEQLNVPAGSEFGFGFVQSDGTKVEVGNATGSINVFAEEVPVQYIDAKANILSGFINVKVW